MFAGLGEKFNVRYCSYGVLGCFRDYRLRVNGESAIHPRNLVEAAEVGCLTTVIV